MTRMTQAARTATPTTPSHRTSAGAPETAQRWPECFADYVIGCGYERHAHAGYWRWSRLHERFCCAICHPQVGGQGVKRV